MESQTWYDLFPDRLVLETIRVESLRRGFVLKRYGTLLFWECVTSDVPSGITAPLLSFELVYPEAFPAVPPGVQITSRELDPSEWGHKWHRWQTGNVCYVRPSRWQVSTTADEIIRKVFDWYFNYTAKKAGLIEKMPDLGRAVMSATVGEPGAGAE